MHIVRSLQNFEGRSPKFFSTIQDCEMVRIFKSILASTLVLVLFSSFTLSQNSACFTADLLPYFVINFD